MNLAPIVLFVYNRLDHTKETIYALQKNELALETELYIYSDAAKNEEALEKVNNIREFIKNIEGFKNVHIVERKKNWGLANSIIDGITHVINQHNKVIVLEDDIVTSPYFLTFMNKALDYYQHNEKVWHISGWNYPISNQGIGDVYLWRLASGWGWATWSDKWKEYEKNIDKTINDFSKNDIKRFNLDSSENFWGQVLSNKKGKINTWAIFWYSTIFKNGGLCLNPSQTYTRNIGLDGSGVNCSDNDHFSNVKLSTKKDVKFTDDIVENKIALQRVKRFYIKQKKSLISRAINKITRLIFDKNIIK